MLSSFVTSSLRCCTMRAAVRKLNTPLSVEKGDVRVIRGKFLCEPTASATMFSFARDLSNVRQLFRACGADAFMLDE